MRTIVVLLILAVVAIGAVKDSNIIAHAQNAGNQYSLEQEKEKINLAVNEAYIGGKGKIVETDLTGALNTQFGDDWLYLSKTAECFKVQIKSTQRLYKINVGGKIEEDAIVIVSDASYFTYDGATITEISTAGQQALTHLAGKSVKLIIPETYEGTTITTIGEKCFFSNKINTNVFLGTFSDLTIESKTASNIEKNAFANCISLANLSLPAATTIEEMAFGDCTSLTNISLPVATSIGDGAFYSCTSLTNVSLPGALTIEDGVFGNTTNLKTISMPKVTSIGHLMLFDSGIKKIELPSTLTTIENWPFYNSSLTDIYGLGLTEAPIGWNSDWNTLCNAEVHWNTPMPVESQN